MATMSTLSTLPSEHQALKITSPGSFSITSVPLPQYAQDQVLVRVANISLNPVDIKSADLSPALGATSGTDFAGTVVAVGSALKRPLKVGDRVFGCVFGNNPIHRQNGAFASYVAAYADLLWQIPDTMSTEKASTLGVGLVTVGLALYFTMGLNLPSPVAVGGLSNGRGQHSEFVLVYGGGTATGIVATRMLRLSGYVPIVTCSPHSNQRCIDAGAASCFDYHGPTCATDIRSHTEDGVHFALDCISTLDSMRICYASMAPPQKGPSSGVMEIRGRYVALDPFPAQGHSRRSIKPTWIIAFTIFDQPIEWQYPFQRDAKPAHRDWAGGVWFPLVQRILDDGTFEGQAVEARHGGLPRVAEGLADLRLGKIGGRKLVYAL